MVIDTEKKKKSNGESRVLSSARRAACTLKETLQARCLGICTTAARIIS